MSETPPEPSGEPGDPASEPVAPASGRSRYEDYDLTVPTPTASPRRRTPTLVMAGVVLAITGAMALLLVVGVGIDSTLAIPLIVFGLIELAGAALVLLLLPLGRTVGIVLGAVGIVLGILSAAKSPANGLISIALNGFVIYALASSGPAFRRE
jgi:hypothetical protein